MYYVYRHIRLDTNEVFYIGKGKSDRAWSKKGRSDWWFNIKNKCGIRVDIIMYFDSEEDALNKEIELIKLYGRLNNKTGILINLTDGGEGVSGKIFSEEERENRSNRVSGKNNPMYGSKRSGEDAPMFGNKHSEESKKKMSESKKGMYKGEKNPRYGVVVSDETKDRISRGNRGKRRTEEQKQKMSVKFSGNKNPNAKRCENIKSGLIFNSVKEMCEEFNLKYKSVIVSNMRRGDIYRLL